MKNQNLPIKVLFVSNFVPSIGDGASAYTLSILEYLSTQNLDVYYISTGASVQSWFKLSMLLPNTRKVLLKSLLSYLFFVISRPSLLKEYLKTFIFFLYSSLPIPLKKHYRSLKVRLLSLFGKELKDDSDINPNIIKINPNLYDVVEKETVSFVKKMIKKFKPKIIIANYVWMAYTLDFVSKNTLKVIITHDVMHKRLESYYKYNLEGIEPQLLKWNKENEREALDKANLLVAIQKEEGEILKNLVSQADVITVPIAVNLQPNITESVKGRCLFIGSQAKHNYYGLVWFLTQVWPNLQKEIPFAQLHVCGSVCTWFREPYRNVNFMGLVPDLSVEYSRSQVCIIPSIIGSGLKIKLIEALSYGKACVSTRIGLQGMMDIANKVVLLGDTPHDFFLAISELLTNHERREEIEASAKRYITETLSPNMVYSPLVSRFRKHIENIENVKS